MIGEEPLCAARCDNLEAEACQCLHCWQNTGLLAVPDGHKHRPALRHDRTGPQLAFGKCTPEGPVKADNFARRPHFRPEDHIDTGEPRKRENRFFHGNMLDLRLCQLEAGQSFPDHEAGADFGNWLANHLRHKRNGPGCARIDLKHEDNPVLDRKLHIHQPDHIQRNRHFACLAFQFRNYIGFERMRRKAARRITRMDPRFLDMLHDPGNKHVLPVAQAIDIHFDGVAQVAVEQQWVLAQERIDLTRFIVRIPRLDIVRHEFRQCT